MAKNVRQRSKSSQSNPQSFEALARRKARKGYYSNGAPKIKDQLFELWLKDPLGDTSKWAQQFDGLVDPNSIAQWLARWLRNPSLERLPSGRIKWYPASASGREKEIRAALEKVRVNGTKRKHRGNVLSKSKSASPPEAPEACDLSAPPRRVPTTVHRVIRDTQLARRVKMLHEYKCQVCGRTIKLADGLTYAEAHHIQPLGQEHNGPDIIGNILCVCPNHHAELDFGSIVDSRVLRI